MSLTYRPQGWTTVAEDVTCGTDCGDVIYHTGTHEYKLLVWRPDRDNYEPRALTAAEVAQLHLQEQG